jgi:hypothetical protein
VGFVKGGSQFAATLKQSFSSKPKRSTLLKLDGLANNTSLELGYQYIAWHPQADYNKFNEIRKDYATRKKITAESDIKTITLQDLENDPVAKQQLENKHVTNFGTPLLLGATYLVGRNDVDYITDNGSVQPLNRTTLNHTLRLSAGLLLNSSSFLTFSVNFQNLFDLDDPVTYSFPVGTNGARLSKDVVVGTPTLTTRQQFKLEYRRSFLNKDSEPNFSISPSFSLITVTQKFTIELPIYLLRATKDDKFVGLQGGVTLAYASPISTLAQFGQGLGVSVFVAAPFQLLSSLTR